MNQSTKVVLTGLAIGSIPFLFLAWLQISHPNGDIDMESPAGAPAKPDPEIQAKSACVTALRDATRFPSSFDFSPFSDPPQAMQMNDGGYLVRVDFSAKNGFGNRVPLVGHCTVTNGIATVTEIDPR